MPPSPTQEQIRKLPFFFILGRPRSGTTLLRTLLDVHPNINIPLENSGLIHLYFKYRKVTFRDHRKLNNLLSDFLNLDNVRNWRLNKPAIKEILNNLPEGVIPFDEIIRIFYYHYQSEFPKEKIICLGDKSPLNSLYSNRLIMAYPQAKFIHLVRDYRANLASMRKQEFFSPSSTFILMQWKKSVHQIQKLARQYPRRFLLIRYEDLVSNPGKTYQIICKFLQVKYISDILDSEYRRSAINNLYSSDFIQKWQPDLSGKITDSHIDKWKDELGTGEIRKADYIAGKTGEQFQYEPILKDYTLPFILTTETKKLLFHLNEVNRYLYDRLPYKMKSRIRNRKFIASYRLIQFYRKRFGKH